jgi:2-phosphosulfolactate phosphatase
VQTSIPAFYDQSEYDVRCEWGPTGIQALAPTSDVFIIVDVISFTTSVDVALSRGAIVYPWRWKDETAVEFAREKGALLAAGSRRDPQAFSLAPTSLLRLPEGAAIVLPSPNGATLSLATGDTPTFAGCLRNAAAVAMAARAAGRRISVIPAGERWPDGSLRPAIEDWIGTGAILHALEGPRSPEAESAVAVFLHFRERMMEVLSACSSGKEAAQRGGPDDVRLAAEWNASLTVPRLVEGAYRG